MTTRSKPDDVYTRFAREFAAKADVDLSSILFGEQRRMFDGPEKRKAGLCGRRAGKTWVAFVALYEAARAHPGAVCPYLSLTGKSARRILWPAIEEIVRAHGLSITLHKQELIAELPNGAMIELIGADDPRKVERLRGGKYPIVVVDEAGSFPRAQLSYLIEDVLDPALIDYDGELWLMGTPGPIPTGYFYDATTGNGEIRKWPTFSWTVLDNPHIPHAADYLARKRESRGWALDHPTYQREWLGRWVRDEDAIVYRYDPLRNNERGALPRHIRHVLGIDLGASADRPTTAFAVLAYAEHDEQAWVRRAFSKALRTPTDVATEIKRLVVEYDPEKIVCDAGALGVGYVEEFRQRHGLPVKPAEKSQKVATIDLLNGDLRTGRLRVVPSECADLVAEWSVLAWSDDRTEVDDRTPDHVSDATLYAWRALKHWCPDPDKPDDEPARDEVREHAEWDKRRMLAAHVAKLEKDKNTPWYRRRGR